MLRRLSKIYNVLRSVCQQFFADDCLSVAGALSYTTLLSLIPLMTVSLWIASALPAYQQYGQRLQKFLFENLIASKADVIQQYAEQFVSQTAKLSVVGLFFLLVTAVMMIFTMESAFNAIWRVKKRRKGIPAFLMYWAVLTLFPILIAVGIAVSTYVFSLPGVSVTAETLDKSFHLVNYTASVLLWSAFSFLYAALPNVKVRLRHALIGGFVAMTLFQLAKAGFGAYIRNFPTYELLYGALATVPIFLVWLYLSWLIILLGAIVTHVTGATSE